MFKDQLIVIQRMRIYVLYDIYALSTFITTVQESQKPQSWIKSKTTKSIDCRG
jgi:hypothetical protein